MAVEPHEPSGMLQRRIVAVNDGDFVPVAHGAQGGEKLGAQEGINSLQHGRYP